TGFIGSLIVLLILAISLRSESDRISFLKFISFLSGALIVVFCAWSMNEYGFVPPGRSLRTQLDELPSGLSRIINSVCFLYLTFVSGYIYKQGKLHRNLVYLVTACVCWLIFFTFSRQGFVVIGVSLFSVILLVSSKSKSPVRSFIAFVLVLSCMFLALLYMNFERLYLEFVVRSTDQIEGGGSLSNRFGVYLVALTMFLDNPFGSGQGELISRIGMAPHSTYALLLADYGIAA